MATHPVRPIAPARYREGERYRTYPLASGEDFTEGAPIILTSGANTFEEAGADPSSIVGFALAGAADYAWKDDTFGYVDPAVPVALADQEFRGTLGNSDTGTAEVTADVSAVIGNTYGLVEDSETGYWVLNADDTTGGIATVVRVDPDVEDGDGNIPVNFIIEPSARDVIA